jgi:hypothetical protein
MTPEQFIGFCQGNALKYLSRAGKKGDLLIDLRKAQFYLDYEIQTLLKTARITEIPYETVLEEAKKEVG